MTQSTPTPPPGYVHVRPLFADWDLLDKYPRWLVLIYANLVALLPLGGGVLLLWLPYQFYSFNNSPLALWPALTLPLGWKIVLGVLIFMGSMLLHEWLHGLVLQLFGHKPRYVFLKLYLVATIQKGSFLTRRQYLVMTLAPIVTMTLLGGGLLLFLPPAIGRLLLIALLLNTAASIGDILVAWRVYQAPPEARFGDDHGIQLFLPASQTDLNAL
ncbi:DUF3267 domain-containing protein [Candidatus Leptofilum sp.]|uniref:DUF3267 domain-containing protein n=1 Tax=Candidatus Leptofilum sp. TaxID=3241576 RepID=UPI003B5BB37C